MIDTAKETLIPLTTANDCSPVDVHLATWHRWAFRGAKGVRLEVVRIGHRIFTSREAVARFFVAINGDGDGEAASSAPPRSPTNRAKATAAARAKLAAAGVGRR